MKLEDEPLKLSSDWKRRDRLKAVIIILTTNRQAHVQPSGRFICDMSDICVVTDIRDICAITEASNELTDQISVLCYFLANWQKEQIYF